MSSTIFLVELESNLDDVPLVEEALSALGFDPSSYSNKETGRGTTYVLGADDQDAKRICAEIQSGLADWEEIFSDSVICRSVEMAEEDWSQSWKRHFHVFKASERLVVKPSWETYDAKDGNWCWRWIPECASHGYHGTTILPQFDELAEHGTCSFLDAGCGSGILSIGARLLGYDRDVDNDPHVTTSRENMEIAGVEGVNP